MDAAALRDFLESRGHVLVADQHDHIARLLSHLIVPPSRLPRPCVTLMVEARLWFTSDVRSERQTAIPLCAACPVRLACKAEATERGETFGVWGGKDFSPRPYKRKPKGCRTCGEPVRARGYCARHLAKHYREAKRRREADV